MPYYPGPRVIPPSPTYKPTTNTHHCQLLLSQVLVHDSNGLSHLSNNPVTFGEFGTVTPLDNNVATNPEFLRYAPQVLRFS